MSMIQLTEEQFQALKIWIETIAQEAVLNSRPEYNCALTRNDVEFVEQQAHDTLVKGGGKS